LDATQGVGNTDTLLIVIEAGIGGCWRKAGLSYEMRGDGFQWRQT
jgi:hypothetical protein